MNCFTSLSTIFLTGAIALVQAQPTQALSANQVQQIAEGVTVLIDGVNPGSGVIIDRVGETYYVLTARHVVGTPDEYTIVTPAGDRHAVDYSRIVRLDGADLAIVPFISRRTYSTATLATYASDNEFNTVFTAGFTAARSRQFTAGFLSDRTFSIAQTQGIRQDGYDLFYSNLTEIGMSGSAVLDTDGRVIGIHGLAEGETVNDGQRSMARVKRGFSSGIPMTTFLRLLPQSGLNLGLRVDRSPPSRVTADQQQTIRPFTIPTLLNNGSAIDWTNRGNQLYRTGQLPAALAALDRAVQLQPDFYAAWYERGNVLFAMNRATEALESYERTIQLKPDLYGVWRDRAVLLGATQQYLAALGSFDKATELKPDDYVLWYMRGNLLNKDLRNYSQAIASYDRALLINPNFADAWMGKGRALAELGQHTEALTAFDRSLQLSPNLAVALILQSKTLDILGRRPEAIAALQRALQLQPTNSEAQRLLASFR
jgi:tetratricopeptide (TPR) repeat protein